MTEQELQQIERDMEGWSMVPADQMRALIAEVRHLRLVANCGHRYYDEDREKIRNLEAEVRRLAQELNEAEDSTSDAWDHGYRTGCREHD